MQKVCKSCRSRQEVLNEYLLAKFGVDTAENGPLNVCQKLAKRWKKSWKKGRGAYDHVPGGSEARSR